MFSQTLRYIFKGGNQLWLCLPSVLVLLSLLFIPGAISFRTSDGILGSLQQWLIIALLWLPFLCKTIDNAAHIRAGKSADPVPFGLSGELRLPELAQYLVGIAILTLPFIFLPAGLYTPIFYALLPAIHESFLESRTFAAMFSPNALLAAYARIGLARYRHVLLIYLMISLTLAVLGVLLAKPLAYVFLTFIAAAVLGNSASGLIFFILAIALNILVLVVS